MTMSLQGGILDQLRGVAHTWTGAVWHVPCRALLHSGQVIERLLVVRSASGRFLKARGVDRLDAVKLDDVAVLEDSPWRLPAAYAEKLHRAPRTCMGGIHVTLDFRDGSSCLFLLDHSVVEFPDYPAGLGAADVTGMTIGLPTWDEAGVGHRGSAAYVACRG